MSLATSSSERLPRESAAAGFWSAVSALADEPASTRVDAHHGFGSEDELVVDRVPDAPAADSRLVHYHPGGTDYLIALQDRIRWCTRNGVTVFPETSPWDTQTRQDPAVNFHAIVQPPASGGIGAWGRGLRGPFLYPRTEAMQQATLRHRVVFSPAGLAYYVKDLRLSPEAVAADLRLALRVALAEDELLLSFGARNLSDGALRVSLVSFLQPLLTRGVQWNAESAWFHEGWLVPPHGTLIRSSEHRMACGIRHTASVPTERWQSVDTLAYYGGLDRSAAFPAAIEHDDGPPTSDRAGFVAPACAHGHDRTELGPGEDLVVHLALRVEPSVARAEAYLARPLSDDYVEARAAETAQRGRELLERTRLGAPNRSFASFYEWTKQQVSGCARIQPQFRLFANYLLGIRDKAQAAYAAVDFDPALARALVLELCGEQFEDGRFPRQYSPDGRYDLRYFMDSGLWMPTLLVPHYLKSTGDFSVLFESVGYKQLSDWDPETKTGRVAASRRRRTVLDHLLEAVDHVIAQRSSTTGLVRIHDGDWNDAIGLIETSSMVLQQLYWALAEMALLAAHLPRVWQKHPAVRRLHPSRYRALMDDLHDTFLHRCVQRHPDGRLRIVHGFTKEGRTVGGFWDSDGVVDKPTALATLGRHHHRWAAPFLDADGRTLYKLHARWIDPECRRLQGLPDEAKRLFLVDRVSSTPLSFAVLSGILRHEGGSGDELAPALEAAVVRDAQLLDSPYGWKTFSHPFGRQSRELGIGRIGDLDGAENASPYVHAGMFLCQAFYALGHEREAGAFLTKSLPLERARHAGQNRSLQYVPNSWGIGPNNDGASMNDFHTNAASIFSRIVVEEIAGLRATYDGIIVQPAQRPPGLVGERAAIPVEYRARLRERAVRIVHEWTPAVAERVVTLGGRPLRLSGDGRRGAFVPWAALSPDTESVILVRDPLVRS
jgi:hypothetical protein